MDEIPNPEVLSDLESFYSGENVYNFSQDNYQAALNWIETSRTVHSQTLDFQYGPEGPGWIGTKMFNFSTLKKYTMTDMRRPLPNENNMRIHPGGWHWSTVGSPDEGTMEDRILMKIKTTSHVEMNTPAIKDNIVQNISNNKSPLGSSQASYKTLEFTEDYFPEYLINNKEKYSYLIK